ncbi:MAG: hypothetical protein ACI97A_000476 [Planctomycetota bacterium]|jgi:hypothetical protein
MQSFITSFILFSLLCVATPAQEWIRSPQGQVKWARPAPSLVPKSAPIVLKSAPIGQILSKLWLGSGKTLPGIRPGGPLIELARILNSQPGLKAINFSRPIYAAFYHPSDLEHVRTNTNSNSMSSILKHALIVLPVTSEKRFYRSLDSRFERIATSTPHVLSFRLQADRLDYEAWIKATLEGSIDPQDVAPEGFARQGDDRLFCRGNGMYVAMTSNPRIARELAELEGQQEWTELEPPKANAPSVAIPEIATHMSPEIFLDPHADVTMSFRLEGENAVAQEFFSERIKSLSARFENPKVPGLSTPPDSAARAFMSSLTNLMGANVNDLGRMEVSLNIQQGQFDLAVRTKPAHGAHWQVDAGNKKSDRRLVALRKVPTDAAAAGWIDIGVGTRLQEIYVDLLAPLPEMTWQQTLPQKQSSSKLTLPFSPSRFAYYLDLNPERGFSFVELIDFDGKLPKSAEEAQQRFLSDSLLGRTISRTSSPGRQLVFHEYQKIAKRDVLLFRFHNSQRRFLWENGTSLEATLSKLISHRAPIAMTSFDGHLLCVCAEKPIRALQDAIKLLSSNVAKSQPVKHFSDPAVLEHWGYVRPRALQDFVFGSADKTLHSEGEPVRFIIGHDTDVRRFHMRGPTKFFAEFQSMLSTARRQRQRLQTRRRMMLLRRAWGRLGKKKGAKQNPPSLAQLFEAMGERPAVLPPFYRFALEDGWGRPFELSTKDEQKYLIRSLGADGHLGGQGDDLDLILELR